MRTFEVIQGNQKFKDTAFYKWLEIKHKEGVKYSSFIDAVRTYTKWIEAPFKGRTDGQAHKWVYDYFETEKRKNKTLTIS